jgi:uncharacterized membrane-anchored protein
LALPDHGIVPLVHTIIGAGIVGGFAVLMLWGFGAFVFKRGPGEWFWRLLAVLQTALVLELIAGVVLLVMGERLPSLLHFAYGAIFPAVILTLAHVAARGLEDPSDAWKVFAVASFFAFGLTLRALSTGLGLP